jgi:hypothetical protein
MHEAFMSEDPKNIVSGLRKAIDDLETNLDQSGSANPDQLELSIRAADAIVRKLKDLHEARTRVVVPSLKTGDAEPVVKAKPDGAQKRELVILALDKLGKPATPRLISQVIKRLWEVDVQATQFASIRKGDERAWQRGRRARPFIVPALNAFDLSARPRTYAMSTWPAERRVMGTLSDRVDALHLFLRASEHVEGPEAKVWRDVAKVIAADFQLADLSKGIELATKNAKSALTSIEAKDVKERREASDRLARLSEQWQLFGRPLSYEVVEGGKHA